jgi:hypothetical protein
MLTKIKSRRVELPPIFLVENEDDFKQLPKGIPYIIGTQKELPFITMYLEFQTIYRSCLKTKLPLQWLDILGRLGYKTSSNRTITLKSGGEYTSAGPEGSTVIPIDTFIEEKFIVDFDKLAELKILPKWLDDIKESVQVNIIDEVMFDPCAFNKQLGINVGAAGRMSHMKNLLILDVSGSIPNSIVVSITHLAKLMSKKFYADVIVTGGRTYFVDYDEVGNTDFVKLAEKAGRNNEGEMFAAIIKDKKEYNTVICFGDNDSPSGYINSNKVVCNFEVETLFSLHTHSTTDLAGYCKMFKPKTTTKVADWVKTLS